MNFHWIPSIGLWVESNHTIPMGWFLQFSVSRSGLFFFFFFLFFLFFSFFDEVKTLLQTKKAKKKQREQINRAARTCLHRYYIYKIRVWKYSEHCLRFNWHRIAPGRTRNQVKKEKVKVSVAPWSSFPCSSFL